MCRYLWLSPDCVFRCRLQHLVAHTVSYHQPVNTKMINTHVRNVVPYFQDYTPFICMRRHTGAATLTLVTFVERVVCIKATSTVTWHHMARMTLSAGYVHNNIPMPLVSKKHVQYCHKDADGNVPKMPKRGYTI